ncbi:protein UXT [Neolamprologus brichardi]|uniref:protein UXT n=1 Tax=Neolamprologus brichardi TaxID=32507 RepID=UPI001643A491|nr:protein UXT [Neolamprologus brichardi]
MSAPDNATARPNVDQKVLQYETFINEVLKRDLQKVVEQRDQVYEKISQYLQLKNTIQSLQMLAMLTLCLCYSFTEQLTKDSAKIKAHIRMVLEGLRELQGLGDLPETG